MTISPQFGGKVRKKDLKKFNKSKYWNGSKFENLIETSMDINLLSIPKLLIKNFTATAQRTPKKSLEVIPLEVDEFSAGEKPKFVWYGHSVLLLRLNGKNLLIDPMFGPDASPIAPFSTKRFSKNTLAIIDELPKIDAVLLTHDHYDHLDYDSIQKLIPRINTWFVALGVSRHLEKWGVNTTKITEFDWWDKTHFEGIDITFTPSRHFSGRGLTDRFKSLWGGWVFKAHQYNIYWSGDGGYGPHFKAVGDKLGPFDWGFMECGQYNEHWHAIHMYPEESVLAALDARVRIGIPVHWGGFSLALHDWKEPARQFYHQAKRRELVASTPRLGEIVTAGQEPIQKHWWKELD